ncbi:thioesterase family protein [Brevibacterium album]|uniref:thioesterase family protein n=1 Tax=Brevibacterium album TaxID=417948 RepID=UPI001B7F8925|nr:thioesterase family protein [Brevibacterium album]
MVHPFDEMTALAEVEAGIAGAPAVAAAGSATAADAAPAAPDAASVTAPASPRSVTARTHPAWANMVGPFGGATAAQVLAALMSDPRAQGRPAALTLNYTTALADGEMRIVCEPVRTNRSNQHWTIRVEQGGHIALTGTALFASDRETFSDTEAVTPDAGAPADHESVSREDAPLRWLQNYEFRYVRGLPPMDPRGAVPADSSESLVWFRQVPARGWDYPSLAAAADVFYPRVFARTGGFSPAGTISFTVYFHADPAELAGQGEFLLGQAQASRMHSGLFDQVAHVWGETGDLLATTTQLVYFKTR